VAGEARPGLARRGEAKRGLVRRGKAGFLNLLPQWE
jgi:hypothetical protein